MVACFVGSACSRDSLAPPGPSGLVEGIQVADSQSALDTGTLPTQFNFAQINQIDITQLSDAQLDQLLGRLLLSMSPEERTAQLEDMRDITPHPEDADL